MLSNKDHLILKLIDDVKHYQKEIICLRYLLSKDYKGLKNNLISDLTPSFIFEDEYLRLINKLGFDYYKDDKRFKEEINEILNNGYNSNYPFSI